MFNQFPQVNSSTKPKGLLNVGATCYMNAVLQCFYHVKNLTNELFKYQIMPCMSISSAYFDVISQLSSNSNNAANPTSFKNVISRNPLFRGIQANDSKDLILYFFENIENELSLQNYICRNPKYINRIRYINNNQNKELMNIISTFDNCHKSIISDLFYGFTINVMVCNNCKKELLNYQIFNMLIFPIEAAYNSLNEKTPQKGITFPNRESTSNSEYGKFLRNNDYKTNYRNNYSGNSHRKVNIDDCFNYAKSDVEFKGDNQIFCNHCKALNNSKGNTKIYSSPHILVLILDRGKGNKFECDVEFEETLDIKKYVESKECPVNYKLIGIISHLGESSMSGHFIVDCRHFDGKWYTFNDSIVSGPYNSFKKQGTPYILFYQNSELS